MKKVIRKGIFETNSSSTHSISLGKESGLEQKDISFIHNNMTDITIYPGEFGWGPEKFTDAATKASYALVFCKETRNSELLEMLRKVISEETGQPVQFQKVDDDFYEWGYIDHQSIHVCSEVFESEKTLRNFIFNPNSILIIDNDNCPEYPETESTLGWDEDE